MERVQAVAAERGVPLVPWHCPVAWPAFCERPPAPAGDAA
jgi:hypothetical protein